MGTLYDLFLILSIALGGLQLGLKGYLTVGQVVTFFVLGTIFVALSRVFRSRWSKFLFRVFVSISSLLVFGLSYGKGDPKEVVGIIGSVLVLVLMLFGVYVMFRGPFREK